MSLLSKTETAVNELTSKIRHFQERASKIDTASNTSSPSQHVTDYQSLDADTAAFTAQLTDLDRRVAKFVSKANETDPDQQIYGPAAMKRIKSMAEVFTNSQSQWAPVRELVEQGGARAKARKEADDARIAAELAEQKRLAEEARVRAERDKAEAEAEAARQAEVERQRREAEEKARHDREVAEKKAAEERSRAEAEHKKLEAERAAQAEAEHKLKEAADKAAAEEAEAKRRAEEEAKKTPLQRSKEALIAALDTLSSSCTVQADHLIALQMLVKFVQQIVQNPMDANYHKVNVNNPIIKQRLMAKKGGSEALRAIGFESGCGVGDEWAIHASAEAWNRVTQAKGVLEKELEDVKAGRKRTTATTTGTAAPATRPTVTSTLAVAPSATAPRAAAAVPSSTAVTAPTPPLHPFSMFFPPTSAAQQQRPVGTSPPTAAAGAAPFNPFAAFLNAQQQPAANTASQTPPAAPFNPFTAFFNPQQAPSPAGQTHQPAFPQFNPFTANNPFAFNPFGGAGSMPPIDPNVLASLMGNPRFMGHLTSGNWTGAMQEMIQARANQPATPATPATPAIPSTAASATAAPAPATSAGVSQTWSSSGALPQSERELSEEELLEQALAMSMEGTQPQSQLDKEKDKQ